MADTKITGLSAATSLLTTDILPVVVDPGGTPLNKKATLTVFNTVAPTSTPNALGALAIDVTKRVNTKSISADSTFTFSATPPAGTLFSLALSNTDNTTGHAITIPACWSPQSMATVTTVWIPIAHGVTISTIILDFFYDGTRFNVLGGIIGIEPSTGDYTVALGYGAVGSTGGSFSVFLGYGAGASADPGGQQVAVGYGAGGAAGGYAGVYVGYLAGSAVVSTGNVCLGYGSGKTVGANNECIGTHAGEGNTGSGNFLAGYHAGETGGGSNNIIIGDHAAATGCTTADGCIFLGPYSGIDRPKTLWIDGRGTSIGGTTPLIYGEFDNSYLKINGNFEVPSGYVSTAGNAIITKSTATSYTAGTTDAREKYGGIIYVTSACTISLPAIAVGMSVTVITIGNIAVSVDPNGTEVVFLDGVALTGGHKITNLSTAGDLAVLTYKGSGAWHASTNGWSDGG